MTRLLTILSIIFLLAGCAGQRPPEGGPLDTTPPEVISVYPEPNTVNFTDNKIVIEFSEYVDRRSVEEAVFISPAIEDIEFDWSGTEVELIFKEKLRTNTTYVFTIGTDVVDFRNRNGMAKAVTLSFSTGDKIDNGAISGKVFDASPQGVMIFSYRKNEINIDTLNPMFTKPDYITQAGKDGFFTLSNLAAGSYRLYAINDVYRNLLYDPETDAAGTTGDVQITESDTLISNVKFIIAKEDTTTPRISAVTAPDNRHVIVQFSEEMDSLSIGSDRFYISDTNGRQSLIVKNIFSNIMPVNSITLITDRQVPDSLYVLTVDSVKDLAGFAINPLAKQKQFKGSGIQDTIPPLLVSATISDPAGKVLPDQSIEFVYNDEIVVQHADSIIQLRKSKDSSTVDIDVKKNSGTSILIIPKRKLQIDERYFVRINNGSIGDNFGNQFRDSVSVFRFVVDDPERYGSIEGNFAGLTGNAPKVVQAVNLAVTKQAPVKTLVTEMGTFSFPLLTEGQYALKVFDDRNKNRIHDAGRIFPYTASESFIIYKDTIRVRPRWPVDGVFIKE